MDSKIVQKILLALVGSFLFWVLAVLVFTAYAFMPTKQLNQLYFTAIYPIIYLVAFNLVMARIFKEHGWKPWLVNTGLILVMGVLALGLLDVTMGLFEALGLVS